MDVSFLNIRLAYYFGKVYLKFGIKGYKPGFTAYRIAT